MLQKSVASDFESQKLAIEDPQARSSPDVGQFWDAQSVIC